MGKGLDYNNLKSEGKVIFISGVQEYFHSVTFLTFYSKEPNICKVVILHKHWLIRIL
jgi:hypothetical protein